MNEGLTRFREGNNSAAIGLFEKAFGLEPTSDVILDFLNRATTLEILRMVRSEDPRISGIGRQLLKLSRRAVDERISDPDRIQQAIDETIKADGQRLLELRIRHTALFGRNLVPSLIPRLADPEIRIRALAQTWIAQIGVDAVPVLVVAAEHSSPIVRTAVAKLLGARTVRHEFSVATLATLAETDPDRTVQSAAEQSLRAILGDGARIGEAKFYHRNNARFLYLNPHRNSFHVPYYRPTVYHLRDDEVVGEIIADFQVNDRMAEQALYRALKLDPQYQEAADLMLCNDAIQVVEYEEGLILYEEDPQVKAVLDSQKRAMDYVRRPRLLAADRDTLFGALGMALEFHSNEVADALLQIVHRTERRGPTPDSMLAALTETSSRLVRVRAAAALARWNPEDLPPGIRSTVVSVLAEAASNTGIRVAHKIMGHPDNVNRFDALFREANIESHSNSRDVESGITRASQLPPDLLLIDDRALSSAESRSVTPINFFIRHVRKDFRTAEVPILVVLDPQRIEAEKALYEDAENSILVIPYNVDRDAFRADVVEPLFRDRDDAKARAIAVGSMAGNVLMELTSSPGSFPVSEVIDVLEDVILNRPDSIRIPCLGVLGNLRVQARGSLGAIAQQFSAAENSVEVRVAAMTAVGKILDAISEPAPAPVLKIILDGMQEADLRLREASYFAYSAAKGSKTDILPRLFDVTAPEGGSESGPAGGGE